MRTRINTCRFCGERAHTAWLIKYGTRAYAHPACYLDHKTGSDMDALPAHELRKLREWLDLRQRARADD